MVAAALAAVGCGSSVERAPVGASVASSGGAGGVAMGGAGGTGDAGGMGGAAQAGGAGGVGGDGQGGAGGEVPDCGPCGVWFGGECVPSSSKVGTVCRPSASACDAPEACDLSSWECPADDVVPDGGPPIGEDCNGWACDGESPLCSSELCENHTDCLPDWTCLPDGVCELI